VRDERALRTLGARGQILVYNQGKSVAQTAQQLIETHRRIIVLFDWDRTGGHLARRLQELLQAQVDLDLAFRKELAITSGVRSVEDLPSAIAHVQEKADRKAAAADSD
jgi:5S rRNA maturation endonuclease (ribonuclease M5)